MATVDFKQNFLSPTGFRFVIQRMPHVAFFVQTANIPGVSTGYTETPTPFKPLYFHGDRLQYDEFTITVRIDQEMKSYLEVFNWLAALASPSDFEAYKQLTGFGGQGPYSDATLTILNNKQNPAINIKFKDIFPINVGVVQLDTTSVDIDYVTVDFTFKTGGWEIEPVIIARRSVTPLTATEVRQQTSNQSLNDVIENATADSGSTSLYDSNINPRPEANNDVVDTTNRVYEISTNKLTVDEGDFVTFTINTANVPSATTLYFTISDALVDSNDVSVMSGSFIISNNQATYNISVTADNLTELVEAFTFNVREGSTTGPIVAIGPTITINDTSQSS